MYWVSAISRRVATLCVAVVGSGAIVEAPYSQLVFRAVPGLGSNWDNQGLVDKTVDCPYHGKHANREYQTISGCRNATAPTELAAAPNKAACRHWNEACLVQELMTGILQPNARPLLSRITIGSLQDLGYTVDYSQADEYTVHDLGPGCACRRTLTDMAHGETLALVSSVRSRLSSQEPVPHRRLRPETHQAAVAHGRAVLSRRSQPENRRALLDSHDMVYVGDQVLSVLIRQDDAVYGVVVRRE
jgi:hypothetical protein